MLPIFISEAAPIGTILGILGVKFAFGMIYGFIIDFILRRKHSEAEKIVDLCEEEHCHCEKSLIKSSLKHTISITIYIFLLTLIVNILISLIGEEAISGFMSNSKILRTSCRSINRTDTKLRLISNNNRIISIKNNKLWLTNWWFISKCRNRSTYII